MTLQENSSPERSSSSDNEKQHNEKDVDVEKSSSPEGSEELPEEDTRPGAKAVLSRTQFWICLFGFVPKPPSPNGFIPDLIADDL